MFTSCFRPWLKNVACLSSLLSVGRPAIACAKCKSQSRDLARMFLRVIYLVADQSKSLWSSGQIWLAISIWSDLYSNFRQLPRNDEFPVISRGQCLSIYTYLISYKFHIVGTKETLVHLFWTCKYTRNFWTSMFEWLSQNFKDLENVSPSLSLCFGLIDDIKDLLFHHLLLIARHYIYTCRLGNKLPKLQVYIQVLMNSIEIEKQIAFHNNDSNVFVRKWSRFKNNHSQNLLH